MSPAIVSLSPPNGSMADEERAALELLADSDLPVARLAEKLLTVAD